MFSGVSTRAEGPAVAPYLFQVWGVTSGFKSPRVGRAEELRNASLRKAELLRGRSQDWVLVAAWEGYRGPWASPLTE